MITYTSGNILECKSAALVNPVNCMGVMGKGLALQFKKAYPANFLAYRSRCSRGWMLPGGVYLHEENGKIILNAATKSSWRGKSQLAWINSCLINLADSLERYDIKSMAIPKLGCGLGGLKWEDVKPMMVKYFYESKREVLIYE